MPRAISNTAATGRWFNLYDSCSSGGLLEWDMCARIDRNRLARPHTYASFRPQIRVFQLAIGPPPRHQQTTASGSLLGWDMRASSLESGLLDPSKYAHIRP